MSPSGASGINRRAAIGLRISMAPSFCSWISATGARYRNWINAS